MSTELLSRGRRFSPAGRAFTPHSASSEGVRENRPHCAAPARPVGTCQLKYFSQFLAHFWADENAGFLSQSIRFQPPATDGIVVAHGQPRLGPQGNPHSTRPIAGGVRHGSWRRTRNVSHLGCGPTDRTGGDCQASADAEGSCHRKMECRFKFLRVSSTFMYATLRAAAHDGRLAATFGLRPYFGNVTATATRDAGAQFMATSYRRTYGRGRRRPVAACRVSCRTTTQPCSWHSDVGSASASADWPSRNRCGEQGGRLSMGDSKADLPDFFGPVVTGEWR